VEWPVALPLPAGCWSCPSPPQGLPWGSTGEELGVRTAPCRAQPDPRVPGDGEEAKDEGVLGVPGAQEENILCKERGGDEVPWRWSTGPEDAGRRPRRHAHRPGVSWQERPWWSSVAPGCRAGCALTELVEVGLGALGPGDGAHQAGLEERAPAVDEAALPSDVVLPGTKSRAQPSLSEPPPPPCAPQSPQGNTRSPELSAL